MLNKKLDHLRDLSSGGKALLGLILCLGTLVAYLGVWKNGFVNYDDTIYLTENPFLRSGLTLESLRWAFTSTYANFWHPLTWLSHLFDVELFALKPGPHHLVNLLIHAVNGLLLFVVLARMTGAWWRSAVVAALFLVHPLHVESVAWAAERKDTLSTLFWLLTMGAYLWYVQCPRVGRYLLVAASFICGLLAKPMLVVLPCALLLLDVWPLQRFPANGGNKAGFGQQCITMRPLWEKIPLLLLSAVFSAVAIAAQESGGAVGSLANYPLLTRLGNALTSYVAYIGKMVWPAGLAVHYPYPESLSLWPVAGAGLLLTVVTIAVWRMRRSEPYLAVGWFWYLGTLVPVIGLVQVGSHAMADRYTYIPLIGLFIMLVWGLDRFADQRPSGRTLQVFGWGAILLFLIVLTRVQVGYWYDSRTLFTHALQVTRNNYKAYNNLGTELLARGELSAAAEQFVAALSVAPDNAELNYNYGLTLLRQERSAEAEIYLARALQRNPQIYQAHRDLGNIYLATGRVAAAEAHLAEAVKLRGFDISLRNSLGNTLVVLGRPAEALPHYAEALRYQPNSYEVHYNLALALADLGRGEEAVEHYTEALRFQPYNPMTHNNLANALAQLGYVQEALAHYREAMRIKPDFIDPYLNMAMVLERLGQYQAAREGLATALRLQPGNEKVLRRLQALP